MVAVALLAGAITGARTAIDWILNELAQQPQSGHATARPGVLTRTTITSPASWTSSLTSADNPENTMLTSRVTSLMTDRDRSKQPVTTESATEPLN
jgi:hypothetical protein